MYLYYRKFFIYLFNVVYNYSNYLLYYFQKNLIYNFMFIFVIFIVEEYGFILYFF